MEYQVPPHYREAWAWFARNAGTTVPWKEIERQPFRLASRPKGIYKPEGRGNPALSIKQTLDSTYPDIDPVPIGSTWVYQYHQEGTDVDFWTNQAVVESMRRGWPVGALRQAPAVRGETSYTVLGLTWVVEWRLDYFMLQGLTAEELAPYGNAAPPDRTPSRGIVTETIFDPALVTDQRTIRIAPQVVREGQAAFRRTVLAAYGGVCPLSGFDAPPALQAAHIAGYAGPPSNAVQNGLLLRADLHLLFDSGLLAVRGHDYTTVLDEALRGTRYATLHGRRLTLPASQADWPSANALEMHRLASGL